MRILDVDSITVAEAATLTSHLVSGETIHAAFSSPTGLLLFTDRRILLVVREHLLEEKVETSSFPYREVRHFSIVEGSSGEGRSALKIWLASEAQPLHLRSSNGADLRPLQALLADRL